MPTAGTSCRAGVVLPGGIINCNNNGDEYEAYIEDGGVFLETDGEGTMEIETNSSDGICDTGYNAIELDISVTKGGKTIQFDSDGEIYASERHNPASRLRLSSDRSHGEVLCRRLGRRIV